MTSAPPPPRSPRWAKASSSANCHEDLSLSISKIDPSNPRQLWVTLCQPVWDNGEPEKPCDGGRSLCICTKPADDHGDHIWMVTAPGMYRFFQQRTHCELRNPDNFRMHTFEDHEGCGVLETVQNLVVDFGEVEEVDWKGRWGVCEALAWFMKTEVAYPLARISNAELANWTYQLLGRMFLRTLAEFESKDMLGPNSEVRNLGVIMALWMDWTHFARKHFSVLYQSKREFFGPQEDGKIWFPHRYDNQILAYAAKYDIKLVGPHNLADIIAAADTNVDLPVVNAAEPDPFGFTQNLAKYVDEFAGMAAHFSERAEKSQATIGGDYLDLTSWTSEERKKKHFRGQDPLPQNVVDAVQRGLVLQMSR